MSSNLPDILGRIRIDTTDLEASVGRAAKAGSAMGSAIGSAVGTLSANGLAAAGDAVKDFATGSVDAFAAVEDATGVAGVVFGENAARITAFADQAGDAFGLSKRQALEAQNTFGALGKAAGLSGADLTSYAQQFTGLAGDLASFKGTSTEQAIQAIGAAMRGEMEPIRAYDVGIDDAALRQEALRQGLVKTTNEALTPQQKALAASALILKQTTDAQGDFAKTMDSTANTAKRQTVEMENQQVALGEFLAPAITTVREGLIHLISGLASAGAAFVTATAFVEDHATAFTVAAGILGTIFGPALIAAAATATASAAKIVAGWVTQAAAATAAAAAHSLAIAKQVAGWVLLGVQSLLAAAKIAAAWLISLGPIALVIAAVVGLVALVVANMDKIKAVISAAWAAVKAATAAVWDAIKGAVSAALGFLVSAFLNFTGPGLLIKHWDTIKTKTTAAFAAVKDTIADKLGDVVDLVRGIPGRITGALGDLGSLLRNAGARLIDGLIDGIRSKLSAIGDVMGDVASKVGSFLPGSPIKTGPLTSWNNGGAGKRLMSMLEGGIVAGRPGVESALEAALQAGAARPGATLRALAPVSAVPAAYGAASTSDGSSQALIAKLDEMIDSNVRLEREFSRQNDRYIALKRQGAIA